MFSRTCEYALQAVLYVILHHSEDKYVTLKEIADKQNIPSHFLSKIMNTLVKGKILGSIKGPGGGFFPLMNPESLNLLKIVEITDGLDIFDRCAIGLHSCQDEQPCPLHEEYKLVKLRIRNLLSQRNTAELCEEIRKGKTILNVSMD